MSLRREFLRNWQPFPPFQSGTGARVLQVEESKFLVQLGGRVNWVVWDGSMEVFWGRDRPCRAFSAEELQEFLVAGDWVTFDGHLEGDGPWKSSDLNRLFLVAPTGSGRPLQPKTAAQRFSLFVEDVRAWFLHQDFYPAQTPSLVTCPGMEPPLAPFRLGDEPKYERAYLPTSPELHLKKLLCRGYGDLFEIKRVFRKEVATRHHQPEFMMLEWYRNFANLSHLERDLKKLIQDLQHQGWDDSKLKLSQWTRMSVKQTFKRYLDFDLSPETPHQSLLDLAGRLEVGFQADDDTWDDTFFKIFLTRIEPQLSEFDFVVLTDYPPSQAALARCNADGWAERMELYIRGVEVSNAFDELNNPQIQEQRFFCDRDERRDRGLEDVPIDEEFLKDLSSGMPPCAGIALGLERLYMALMGIEEIAETTEFPHES